MTMTPRTMAPTKTAAFTVPPKKGAAIERKRGHKRSKIRHSLEQNVTTKNNISEDLVDSILESLREMTLD